MDGKSFRPDSDGAWVEAGALGPVERRLDRLATRCLWLEAACAVLAAASVLLWASRPASSGKVPREMVAGRLVGSEVVCGKLTVMDGDGRVYAEVGQAGRNGSLILRAIDSKAQTYIDHEGVVEVGEDGVAVR